MTHNNWDKYLDPPDEPEEEYCESCGIAMEVKTAILGGNYRICHNQFCPAKHEGVAKEMSQYIVELLDAVETYKNKIRKLERKITALEFQRDENGGYK